MSDFTRTWEASDKSYNFYDALDGKGTSYGSFSGLYGGDMTISMISYNTIGENGGVLTKYLPGQVTYAPIKLTGTMSDDMAEFEKWFNQAVEGNFKKLRRNCSIAQFKKVAGGTEQLVIWNLINAIPIALPGFSYNSYQRIASTSFKVLLQTEEIDIVYPHLA